jgi:glutamyl-tRNA synthetase
LDSLVEQFNLSKVHKAGARFDFAKARWFNQQHLRALEPSVLRELLMDEAANRGFSIATPAMADSLIELFMERAEFISDILDASTSIFETPTAYEEKMVAKKWTPDAAGYVRGLKALFAETNYSAESLEASFKAYLASHELGFGQVGPVLRLAIAGVTKGPSIFAVMALLGQSTSESRMDASIQTLG